MSDMSQAPAGAAAQPASQPGSQDASQGGQDQSKVCVCVELDPKTGAVTYGLDSDDDSGQDDDSNMQPAQSIDEAFAKAKQLLMQASGQAPSAADQQGVESAFASGFKNTTSKIGGGSY